MCASLERRSMSERKHGFGRKSNSRSKILTLLSVRGALFIILPQYVKHPLYKSRFSIARIASAVCAHTSRLFSLHLCEEKGPTQFTPPKSFGGATMYACKPDGCARCPDVASISQSLVFTNLLP